MANERPLRARPQQKIAIPGAPKGPGDDPTELHAQIVQLRARADLAKTLMAGTEGMRAAAEKYLPRMKHEDQTTYDARLKISVLRNIYRQSLMALAGKLMRNGLKLDTSAEKKGPAEMADWLKDLDCCGTAGDVLFKRMFVWSVRDAASWLLADYPPTGGAQTLADERELGIRPWLIPLSIWDVYGWRTERSGGRDHVVQFRYAMTREKPLGLYGTEKVEIVRVVEPTVIYDLARNARGEYERVGEPMTNTLGRVALHRMASDMDENAFPRGGMADLAWLNLEHWQLRSDQRLTLRINSFPILFGAGMETLPPIGPESAVLAQDHQATLQYVESGGTNITAGRQELIDVEDAMRAMSAQYQVRQGRGAETATAATYDAKEANAPAQGWALNAKRAFESAMDDMAELAGKGKGPGAGGTLRIDTDSLVSSMTMEQLGALKEARAAREISRETFLAGLKRADVLPDDFDAEHDQELIDEEPVPELEGMNTPPGGKPPKKKPAA